MAWEGLEKGLAWGFNGSEGVQPGWGFPHTGRRLHGLNLPLAQKEAGPHFVSTDVYMLGKKERWGLKDDSNYIIKQGQILLQKGIQILLSLMDKKM